MIRHLLTLGILTLLVMAPQAQPQNSANLSDPQVVITTNQGTIRLRLFANQAPATVENFLRYVDTGFYSNTIFHRVISNFMIQGGGFTTDFIEKATAAPVVNESKNRLHNTRGTITMARTSDPDSATSQFFINQRNNMRLDWAPGQPGYTVFGEVIQGLSVVDFIATAPTTQQNGMQNVPIDAVIIRSITRVVSE